ncbi:MAG: MFS transporter [Arcobacter sp.]|nr:MAG: MFS transporter [Arcobacter sp.]
MIKSIMPLSAIISLRFFGLFIVLPVISVYAMNLQGATTSIVGIIVGGYALTQMIFQVPFGIMSDKLGRKGTIIVGLILFGLGSILCSVSTDVLTLLLGRLMQGAGAIGAVVTAMISDLVKEEQRPKAMALMGGSIAMAFAFAMILGPTLGSWFGVEFLFIITAIIAFASIFVLLKAVPNPPKITHTYNKKGAVTSVLFNKNLIKMNITNFLQKGFMTFAFMIIPMVLINNYEWVMSDLWKVYLPATIFGVIAMAPAAILAEKKGKFKEVLIAGIIFFGISYLLIGTASTPLAFVIGVVLFFVGFNVHEPIMQSLASKYAKVHQRGFVLGIFNSYGYFGTFLGGLLGVVFFESVSLFDIVIAIAAICVAWAIMIFTLPNPLKKQTAYLNLEQYDKSKMTEYDNNDIIDEWYVNDTENLLIIKYDIEKISEDTLKDSLKIA